MKPLLHILLIEDDSADSDYLREILVEQNTLLSKIDCVQNLKEALSQISAGSYDIILADLSLPDSQGIETFSSIKKIAANLPIVVLTGLDDEKTALETLRQGAQDYLVKGQFNGAYLVKTIQYAIERNKIQQNLSIYVI